MWVYPSAVSDISRKLAVQPPSPVLQVDPARDLLLFCAQEEQAPQYLLLGRQAKGIVHVPIEEAMKKLAGKASTAFPKATSREARRRGVRHCVVLDHRSGRGARPIRRPKSAAFAFRPHPGAELPLTTTLVDEYGQRGAARPVLYRQAGRAGARIFALQDVLRADLGECRHGARRMLPLDAGRDFQLLAISIDPRDTPAEMARAKAKYLAVYHHDGGAVGIHFLTGSAASVSRIADAIGFPVPLRCRHRPVRPSRRLYSRRPGRHGSAAIFSGSRPHPAELGAGLAEAAQGETLSPLTRLFLLCHVEGAPLGRYTVPVMAGLMIGNIAAGAALIVVFADDPAQAQRLAAMNPTSQYQWVPFWPRTAALNGVVVNNLYIAELGVCGLIMAMVVGMMADVLHPLSPRQHRLARRPRQQDLALGNRLDRRHAGRFSRALCLGRLDLYLAVQVTAGRHRGLRRR